MRGVYKDTMESEHILSLTTDYALGLLTAEERRRVERHAGQCPDCRAALQREHGIEALVRGTVHQATRPAPGRLAALRPAANARPAPRPAAPLLRRLAPMTVATVVMALALLLARDASPFTPAVFAGGTPTQAAGDPTATTTYTPTATLAAVELAPTAPPVAGELAPTAAAGPASPEPQAGAAVSPTPAPVPAGRAP